MTESFSESVIKFALAMMTPRQIDILRKVRDGESLMSDRGQAFIGNKRTSIPVIDRLLRHCAVSVESESRGCEYYQITETGREILKRLEGKR